MPYDLTTHRHRFAIWTAARAVQRGYKAKTPQIAAAIINCGVLDFLGDPANLNVAAADYKTAHTKWCNAIIKHLTDWNVPRTTFGRAAKMIAVFLKSAVVLGSDSSSMLASVVYPPIDGIELKQLAKSTAGDESKRRRWGKIRWTQLNETRFYALVDELREVVKKDPFWHLENYWNVTDHL